MWKKEEAQDEATQQPDKPAVQKRPTPPPAPGERATIGRSITIRGEVTGEEDLVIQGRVEGSVDLKQHEVAIGPEGEVTADVSGRVVTVEGRVEGNLRAHERVILRDSARVQGDITAPRVTLEDGAYFRGGVEMTDQGEEGWTREAGASRSGRAPVSGGASRSGGDSVDRKGESRAPTGEGAAEKTGAPDKDTGSAQRTG